MNISGIRPQAGFYDFNSIKFRPEITSDEVEDAINGVNSLTISVEKADKASDEEVMSENHQGFGAYDFAAQYKPGENFDMKGEDSDIHSLDVERAVNDMQRDTIIHQYQFFVGDATVFGDKGVLSPTENFTL